VGVTGLAAAWWLQVDWMEGLLVGAIVGSTDAAAVFYLLHAHGLRLKPRIDATLQIESGVNDPMAIFLTLVLVEMLAAGHAQWNWQIAGRFAQQMGIGLAAGLLGGGLLAWLINRITLSAGLYPLLAFSGGLLIFGATAVVGGSGYLAAYLAGLVLGNRPLQGAQNIRQFHDGMAWLSQISMFLILGLLVTPSHLLLVAVDGLLIALVLMVLARPVAVGLCLLPFRFPWREEVFISWVGLRGAVPIILALFPLLAGLEHAGAFFNVAFFVVLVSLVVQGWTVAPAARLLKLEIPPRPSAVQRVQLDLPGQPRYELVAYQLTAQSPALHCPPARLPLPDAARLAGVLRQGTMLHGAEVEAFLSGDYVYLFAWLEQLPVLDRLFLAVHAPARLEEQRFFGEMALNGGASMAEVARFYGLDIPAEAAAGTLEDFMVRAFAKPVLGDRISVGPVEFVVREMQGPRILKVGLKLKL
ncbi:MAG: potassium/proton antiporter, partial [Pseudomonadota bacterium]|nr:potassium/proton antiporter [Pseudomonadota bacterium]